MSEIMTAASRLIEKHGGVRAAGRATGINYAYLSRLRSGANAKPSAKVLKKLGLREVKRYQNV